MCVEAHTAYIVVCMGEHTVCVLVSLPAVCLTPLCFFVPPIWGSYVLFLSPLLWRPSFYSSGL